MKDLWNMLSTELGYEVGPRLRELAPLGQREPGGGSHTTYRVIQTKWTKAATPYIWYGWTNPEILLDGGSHKLLFLFGVS